MKPFAQNILVKPYPSDDQSEGGIFVPESCREISNKVLIVDVGEGTPNNPMRLCPGQTGFTVKDWCKTGGQELLIDGVLHYLISQDSIIALEASSKNKQTINPKSEENDKASSVYEIRKENGRLKVNLVNK